MFYIYYTSYHKYNDREAYLTREEAERRYNQLAALKYVTKLELKEVN